MGATLSKAKGHFVTRPLQRFNIDNRTERLLNKDKPTPAPKFKEDIEFLQKIKVENPTLSSDVHNQSPKLLSRLKEVYVTSKEPSDHLYTLDRHIKTVDPDRPLPQKRSQSFNIKGNTPSRIQTKNSGKLNLNEITNLLSESNKYTVKELAKKYGLDDENTVQNLIIYYRIFDMYTKTDEDVPDPKDPLLPGPDWEKTQKGN